MFLTPVVGLINPPTQLLRKILLPMIVMPSPAPRGAHISGSASFLGLRIRLTTGGLKSQARKQERPCLKNISRVWITSPSPTVFATVPPPSGDWLKRPWPALTPCSVNTVFCWSFYDTRQLSSPPSAVSYKWIVGFFCNFQHHPRKNKQNNEKGYCVLEGAKLNIGNTKMNKIPSLPFKYHLSDSEGRP